MEQFERPGLSVAHERAVLAACLLPDRSHNPHDPLDELRSLAETAGATVADEALQARDKPDPGTFIGAGKAEQIAQTVRDAEAQVVLFDHDLSPRQLANVERAVGCKVLDRSELILDIFALRARTREARRQVELAQLEYTYPRLRAMWPHLERISGGAPAGIGTRGPGEKQIEIDRRIVQRRRTQLKREIRRFEQRKQMEVEKRNEDFFTVGLVGYTNAGKSTLFNALVDGGAHADDQLFATLSPRTRRWSLGDGESVMLSDTVGFVRELPHHLVASFRATLEESLHADLLLVLVDAADSQARQQLATVTQVLDEIGAGEKPRLLLLNKVDRLADATELTLLQHEHPDALPLSAVTGRGAAELVQHVRSHARGRERELELAVDCADGRAIQFLEHRADILDRAYDDGRARYRVRLGQRQLDQLCSLSKTVRITERGEPTRAPAGS
jgi:GTP-binding protein HflX